MKVTRRQLRRLINEAFDSAADLKAATDKYGIIEMTPAAVKKVCKEEGVNCPEDKIDSAVGYRSTKGGTSGMATCKQLIVKALNMSYPAGLTTGIEFKQGGGMIFVGWVK